MINRNSLERLTGKALEFQVKSYFLILNDCSLETFLNILVALNHKAWVIGQHEQLTTFPQYYEGNTKSNQELLDVIEFYGFSWLIDADESVVLDALMKVEDLYDYRFGRRTLKDLLPEWYN